ncbi:hypothetical protein M378DRAFT_158956 [Amanita muscaria Koide BX008]|uniref:Fe2OG dioxygenase domain-containing protein n=1 Tax=Amanita muscaria (strain Koide BX008) TaxID=946122 RepID=A0A0C2XFW3_AMAMK|nr:hypothetical protein M378DRAFT_158956 [Amanita muscaria Koide BX008]
MSLLQEKAASDSQAASFSNIPVIDLTNITSSDPTLRQALAREVRNACINVGFFYVSNHSIPEAVINNGLEGTKQFFSLPLESKMELENKKSPSFRGYAPILSGNNNPENAGDLHEGFQFGWEELVNAKGARGEEIDGAMSGANQWPSETEAPDFRRAALTYYHAAVELGKLLFPIFALALELPEDYFEDKTRHSAAIMGVLHYPPQTSQVDGRVIGIGAHTDWECFTILWQEPQIQALQVLNADKKWIDAPPIDGTLVINLGDQFARWTNDVFKSTVHRAINRSGVRRYSIPLFFGTDYNVKLEPIPSCVSEARPPKYEVVNAGDYVKSRFQATFGGYSANA